MNRAVSAFVLVLLAATASTAQSPDPRCRTAGLQCARTFSDVPSGHWAGKFIRQAVARGWMTDCGGTSFCPDATIPRGDMAVIMVSAIRDGESVPLASPTGFFKDVPATAMRACWIEQLKADGVVAGCRLEGSDTFYCPNSLVNRAQMAVFLAASAGIPPVNPPTGYFTDVHNTPYQWAEGYIEAIYNAGITAGCGVRVFCPGDNITRAQLAVWNSVAFAPPRGTDTVGLWRSSDRNWILRNSNSAGSTDLQFVYGGATSDVPVVGDWNADGVDTVGYYRPSTLTFYLRNTNSAGAADITVTPPFAQTGDIPVSGDWDGDGVDTIGVFRPSTRTWYLRNSNTAGAADLSFVFGATSGVVPVAGDWNGDGIDTIGYYRTTTLTFYLRDTNSAGAADYTISYGATGDKPVTGDWNANGIDTIGVYRPSSSTWLLRNSNTAGAADLTFVFPTGVTNQTPVTGDWNGS